jgi:hypothetical protein
MDFEENLPFKNKSDKIISSTNTVQFNQLQIKEKQKEDSLINLIKNYYMMSLLKVAGEQRNAEAWSSYWNKIPKDVLNNKNMNYVIYATSVDDSNNSKRENVKLDSNLNLIDKSPHNTIQDGISIDVGPDYVYFVDSVSRIFQTQKNDLSADVKSPKSTQSLAFHITYGPDNFLYISTDRPSIEKWDPVSLTKIQENTDLWLEPLSFDVYKLDTTHGNPTQTQFENAFDTSNSFVTLDNSGTYNLPKIVFEGAGVDLPVSQIPSANDPQELIFGVAQDGSWTGYAIDFYGTNVLHVRDTGDYDIGITNDDSFELYIDGTKEMSYYGSKIFDFTSQNPGISITKNLTAGTHDIQLRTYQDKYTTSLWVALVVKRPGDSASQWRSLPLFSGDFGYLNYDADGNLYAQNDYGIFKWDARNMICLESQPVFPVNKTNVIGDVTLGIDDNGNKHLFTQTNKRDASNNYNLERINADTLLYETSTYLRATNTIHFNQDGNLVAGDDDGILIFNPYDLNEEINVNTNAQSFIKKITITPNGQIYAGDSTSSGTIVEYNPDLTTTGNTFQLGSACTGLVYDIE